MAANITQIPAPRVPLIDANTNTVSREWFVWFNNLYSIAGTGTGIVAVVNGGTGLGTIPTNGQLLIGNGNGYSLNTLFPGAGISISNGIGAISITNTLPDRIVALTGAGTTTISGTYPNFTITSNDAYVGTVTAVTGSGNIASTGGTTPNITFTGVLPIANGGTNGTSVPTAGAVPYGTGTAYGFTAAGTAGQILTSNGAGVPTWTTNAGGDVTGPASSTDNAIARFDGTTGKLIQNSVTTIDDTGAATGFTTFAASTSVTTPIVQASNSAGLSLKNASGTTQMSVGAGGGDNMSINVSTNLNGTNAQIDISPTGTGHVHIKPSGTGSIEVAPTNVGTIDNMTIGATTPKNGSFVDLSVTGTTSFDGSQGTAGQVLTSAGIGATPTWSTLTSGSSILYGDGSGGFSNVTIGSGVSFVAGTLSATGSGGTVTSVTGTSPVVSSGGTTPAISLAAAYGDTLNPYGTKTATYVLAGPTTGAATAPTFRALVSTDIPSLSYVTSVGFTGGLITVATPTTTPALTVAGTSGGIVYFSSASTWASSALLTQYGVVYGGGAGAAPVSTAAGTTGQVLTATTSGAPTWANPATSGTVTSVSVVSANGFAGTVATATSTPAITLTTSITGVLKGDGTAISAAVANTDYQGVAAPVTKTANFTVANGEIWYINNKTGSTCTVTLPAASSWSGRQLSFKNMQSQTLVSASSNVVPIDSTSAGTAILLGVVGNWATMVSDGTNWIIMQAAANNCLLLE